MALISGNTVYLTFKYKEGMNHLTQCRIYTKFRSTPDLLAVVSDRIDRAFIRSGDARVVAFDISEACERVWLTDFLYKPKYYGISG